MSRFGSILQGMRNAKPVSDFLPKLPVGSHKLILKRFEAKDSQQGLGTILEADFLVAESNTIALGNQQVVRGWPWFIGASGWMGQYANSYAKEFMEKLLQCVGDTRTYDQAGEDMLGDAQAFRGVQIAAEVRTKMGKDGSPMLGKNGEEVRNISWRVIPQTMQDVENMRAQLDQLDGRTVTQAVPVAAVQAPPPAPVQAPAPMARPAPAPAPAPAAGGQLGSLSGILGGLKR